VNTTLVSDNLGILNGTAQCAEGNLYLIVLENNLLFLTASSKKGNSLIDTMKQKIERLKEELEELKEEL
jgi:hypothetical protein